MDLTKFHQAIMRLLQIILIYTPIIGGLVLNTRSKQRNMTMEMIGITQWQARFPYVGCLQILSPLRL